MKSGKTSARHLDAKVKISLIVIAVLAAALILVAVFTLPTMAPVNRQEPPTVTAIVPKNGGLISKDAKMEDVSVEVMYSDGSKIQVALSELLSTGLNTTELGVLENVILSYGGFTQSVTYQVVPTKIELSYVPSPGGRVEGETLQYVDPGDTAGTVVAVPEEGYRFVEWSDGSKSAVRTDERVSKKQKLTAVFEKIKYTVVFYCEDGTTAREELVPYNESATKVPHETESRMKRYGYKFIGWDQDYTHVTSDMKIYPQYEKYAADFHFEMTKSIEGTALGTVDDDLKEYYTIGEIANVRVQANPDRTFVGWSIRNHSGDWVSLMPENDSQLISVGDAFNYISFTTSKTGTIDQFTLSFEPTENTVEIFVKANFIYDESELRFLSMGNLVHTEILPKYTAIGTLLDVYDASVIPAITGYTFKGWYVRGGEVDAEGKPVLITNDTTFTQPTDLIAQWEKDVYKVVFLRGENESADFISDPYYNTADDGIVLNVYYQDALAGAVRGSFPEGVPVRKNYTFKGWYLQQNGEVTDRIIDKTFQVDQPVTYVAPVFIENTQTLSVIKQNGAGNVYLQEVNAEGLGAKIPVTGIATLRATQTYLVTVEPSTGYTMDLMRVRSASGAIDVTSTEFTVHSPVISDYELTIVFGLTEYLLTVTNGSEGASGTITYQELQGNELQTVRNESLSVSTKVSRGVSKHVWIEAPQGLTIASVSVDGVRRDDLPLNATNYTLVLTGIRANVSVIVTYDENKYTVTVTLPNNEGQTKGTVTKLTAGGYFGMNDRPQFRVSAQEGYYIKSFSINGLEVDPYGIYDGNSVYSVSELRINDKPYGTNAREGVTEKDVRLTSYVVTLNGVDCEKTLSVEFEEIYYEVRLTAVGVGTVTPVYSKVSLRGDASAVARAADGYYVYSVTINGAESVYTDRLSERMIELSYVNEDKNVTVNFRKRVYTVTFEEGTIGTGVKVSYVDRTEIKRESELPTSADVEANTSCSFKITSSVERGYLLEAITLFYYEDGVRHQQPVTLGFDVSEYTLQMNNVSRNYVVRVDSQAKNLDVTVRTANGDGVKVSSTESGESQVQTTVGFDSSFTMYVIVPEGKEFRPEDAILNIEKYDFTEVGETGKVFKLEVVGLRTDLFVYLPFVTVGEPHDDPYHVFLEYVASEGTLTADKETVGAGESVTFEVVANRHYTLQYLFVNGKPVNLQEGRYVAENVEEDLYVQAIFEKTPYLVVITPVANGVVTADRELAVNGEEVTLRLLPATGYVVSALSIRFGTETAHIATQDELDQINAGTTDYVVRGNEIVDNMYVVADFSPMTYRLTVTSEGEGGFVNARDTNANYGETIQETISTDENHFIQSIEVNGVQIDPAELSNAILNPDILRYTGGKLIYRITGETEIKVTFAPNVYRVNVTRTLHGTTRVKVQDGVYSDGNALELSADSKIYVHMLADTGYHIKELYVNGALVDEVLWKSDFDRANNNRNIEYCLEHVTGTVSVRVEYEINTYNVQVNTVNNSMNFARFDTVSTDYGTVRIYGYQGNDGLFQGIRHGSDLRFIISPVRVKGYYITSFRVTWVNPDDKNSGVATVVDLTSAVNPTGGEYVWQNIRGDLQSVEVQFRRELYSIDANIITDQRGTPFACTGDISYQVTNPRATTSEVQLVENKFEYGLTYVVRANPGTGYERTKFMVNGEDNNALVRNNAYSGTVQSNLDIVATYTIRSYEVRLTWNTAGGNARIEDENGSVLWAQGIAGGTTVFTESGRVDVYADYLLATHDTKLYFILIPFNAQNVDVNGQPYDNGYMTASFNINNRRMDTAVDALSRVRYAVASEVSAVADFQLHTYEVTYDAQGGAYVTVEPSTVVWGTGTSITVTPHDGYQLKYVSVNDVDNRDIANAINNTNRYVMFNIRNDVHIVLAYERIPYSITFTGKYHHADNIDAGTFVMQTGVVLNEGYSNAVGYFTEDGVFDWSAQKPAHIFGMANTGIVDGGGDYGPRHGDILTVYFMPATGYRISAVSVTMADGRQVVTKVSSTNDLFLCNEAKGYYSVNIGRMTGNVTVQVEYEIKTYRLTTSVLGEGRADADYGAKIYVHHDKFSLQFTATYGYHLAELTINGQPIETAYEKVKDAGRGVYRYRTAELQVSDNLLNRLSEIRISATFRVNTFRVLMYVNGKIVGAEDSDVTLMPELANSEISAGLNAYIIQNRAEGYSITSIVFSNNKSTGATELLEFDTPENRTNAILTFHVSGDVLDMLDYHSTGEDRYLRVDYTTEIDYHTSVMNTALFETGYTPGTDEIPVVNGVPAFTLIPRYAVTPGYAEIDGSYPYFTTAEFQLNVNSAVSSLYTFTGFQEKINGTWQYVKDGENGVKITSEGRVLTYTVKADREFRAAVYRVYNVEVQIHPEYKHIGGTYYGNSGDMNYTTYGRLVATADYSERNIPGMNDTVEDSDGVDNATYTYRVLYGTRLTLVAQDRNTQFNPTRSRQYFEIDTSSGELKQTPLSMEAGQDASGNAGAVIGKDTLIHAYFRNNMRVSVKMETEGGDTGSEGGTVSYKVNGSSAVLANNSLVVYPNDVVEITVQPRANYRIDTVYQQDYDARASAQSGRKEFLNTWTELTSDSVGWMTVTPKYDGSRLTEMKVVMRVTENTILRIRFIKLIQMTAKVELMVSPDDLVGNDASLLPSQEYIDQLTPTFVTNGRSPDGIYDYGDQVIFRLNAPDVVDIWGIRYQFAGYFVNGVNSYKMLSIAYPEDYDITYHLYNYDELTAPDGVPIETKNGAHCVDIVARYVPVYNITLENEYYFESGSTSRYFDPGQISYSAITYNMEYPTYYESAAYVEGKTSADTFTDKTFQVMGKINTVSGINNSANSASSGYNTWKDNVITLNWVGAANSDNAAHYTFEAWEYYDAVKREWKEIPYVDPYQESNMVTRRTYSFPVSWFFGISYQMDRFSPAEGYKYMASQYTESGESLNRRREISTIRIRPRFQRTETMTIDRVMYYTQMGIIDDEHAADCPAVIEGTANQTTGSFSFYKDITLQNALRFGYRFLGWYYTDSDEVAHEITQTEPLSDTNHFCVSEDGSSLTVRMVDTFVIEARYIKIWTIGIQIVNQSGISAGMTNRLPYIDFYGTTDPATGGQPDASYRNRREITISMDAGSTVYFGLSVGGEGTIHNKTDFSPEFDRYVASAVGSSWAGELEAQGSIVPDNTISNPLSVARYQLTANREKTLRVTFSTFGRLTVTNLMKGSALKLSDEIWTALREYNPFLWGEGTQMVWDGETLDADGTVNGTVVINDVPILPYVDYNGVFGCKLKGMTGTYAISGLRNFGTASREEEVDKYGLIFDGNNASVSCEQTITFFKASASDTGQSNLYYPFDQSSATLADGTAQRPYVIKTANQLAMLDVVYRYNGASLGGIYVQLGASFSATANTALCYEGSGFNGHFDGKNFTISDFSSNKGGLFGKIYGATVENLKFNTGAIARTVSGSGSVGYFANEVINSTIRNVVVTKGTGAIKVKSSGKYAGGFIGEVRGVSNARTSITSCSIGGVEVEGASGVGGFIGSVGFRNGTMTSEAEVTITSCTATSPFVNVNTNAGGFIGLMCGGSVTNCTVDKPTLSGGDSSSTSAVGGFLGRMYLGEISGSTAKLGRMTITAKRYGTAAYKGDAVDVENGGAGGFVGRIDDAGAIRNSNLEGSDVVTLNARYAGGFAGVQKDGTLTNVGIGNVKFYTEYLTGTGNGGSYGVLVGALGARATLQNSTISRSGNTSWTSSDAVYSIAQNSSQGFNFTQLDNIYNNGNPNLDNIPYTGSSAASDECYNLGGLVGYSQGGKLTGNTMSGKIIIHFSCADTKRNTVSVGLLAGNNVNGMDVKSMNGNTIRNASALLFYQNCVFGGGQTQNQYLSVGSGSGSVPETLTLQSVYLKFARCGWTTSIITDEFKKGETDKFKTASCMSTIYTRSGVTVTEQIFSQGSFPKDNYTYRKMNWFTYYYKYENNQRQLIGAHNITYK